MTTSEKKKLKVFNNVLAQFVADFNEVHTDKLKFKRFGDIKFIDEFKQQVNAVKHDFERCITGSLKGISIIKSFNFFNINGDLRVTLSKETWQYLHQLYHISLDSKDDVLSSQENINYDNVHVPSKQLSLNNKMNVQPLLNNLSNSSKLFDINSFPPALSNLVNEVTQQLTNSLTQDQLENMNSEQFLNDIFAGNPASNGIDLSSIITATTSMVKSKVDSGELKITELKDQCQDMLNEIGFPVETMDIPKET